MWSDLAGTGVGVGVATALLLLSVASVWMAVGTYTSARTAFEARLRRLQVRASGGMAVGSGPAPLAHLVSQFGPKVRPLPPEREEELRSQLTLAGWRGPRALEVYLATQVGLAVALPAIYLTGSFWAPSEGSKMIAATLVLTAVGFALPRMVVGRRAAARQKEMQRALPEALDLLVTCVEAGLALDAALRRVADEMSEHGSPLGAELNLAHLEIAAGITRTEALKRMASRTGTDDIRSLVAVLIQTERFGTSIAQALRTQADSLRTRRQLRAEEEAGQSPVKLSAILVVFLLPCLVMVVLSGSAVRVYHALYATTLGR